MVVDFRKAQSDHSPLNINGSNVEILKSTKFLGVHLVEDHTWSLNTSSITKKAQQGLYFLRRLRKAHLPPLILTTFYRGTIESVLSSCITAYCSSLVEFGTVRCRPFYLPCEFTIAFIFLVYIPPSANDKEVLCEFYGAISDLQNADHLELFIVRDFNHTNLKTVLPKFHQHVDFATRGVNMLDLVYINIPGAYRAEPRLHLGYSDHISVMLIPAYRPLVNRSKPVLKQVITWPAGTLQDCFECSDWHSFREAATNGDSINLEENMASVTNYIGKCIGDVTISKTITTHPNQKLWMTSKVCALLKSRDSAFKAGDKMDSKEQTVPNHQRGEARTRPENPQQLSVAS
ncbi:hypothetical protein QTP70_015171 [Hemibagrus guttatus]|uniref:Alkylated DNA repair protein AlkB homologue 8 N-terminal domain-containing protein n=1 Tax=Hemibagrus guttatus TaxID=175788 RepID=A0AAE0V0G4_9TELE|nr:hypothetical protein QTP70_015171 [Hemibagrus guttatus]